MKKLNKQVVFPYVLCFCISNNQVLLIYRNKEPWKDHWNGLGGKIEAGENPQKAAIREVKEEADIDLSSTPIIFSGIVSWEKREERVVPLPAMYVYFAKLVTLSSTSIEKTTKEGIVAWKPLSFA